MSLPLAGKKMSRAGALRLSIALGSLWAAVFLLCPEAGAETAADLVAPGVCAMAHCNQGLTDNTLTMPPSTQVAEAWRDTSVNGSLVGVACVTNGERVVCSFRSTFSKPVELRAYGPYGDVLWSSTALSSSAYYSAPLIDPLGGVVMADQSRIIRFDADGSQVWSRPTAGGNPISPNVTDDGKIILATSYGPVSAYDYASGSLIAQLRLNATLRIYGINRSGYFDTINTPAVKGSRIYLSTRFRYSSTTTSIGRLYALDLLNENGTYRFAPVWYYEFRAPSGTSPTLGEDGLGRTVVYFDGSGVTASSSRDPRAMAVRDSGNSGELIWSYPLAVLPQMSPALDPRGGIWYFAPQRSDLLRLSETNGQLMQQIDVNALVNDAAGTFNPFSVMTIAGEAQPVMLVAAATSTFSRTYVIAIDLVGGRLIWKYRIDEGKGFYGSVSGQYATVLDDENEPVVVFSTRQNGVRALRAQ